MKGTLPYIYFEGKIIEAERAKISIASHSLQYGMTCFGGIRGFWLEGKTRTFRLQDHHARLMNASRILGMDYYLPFEHFRDIIAEMVRLNGHEGDLYIRPVIYSSTERLAPRIPGIVFDLAIYMVVMGQYFDPKVGLKLCVSSWRKFSDNALPTKAKAGGCYVNSSMATTDALRGGYDDALMLDEEGYIVEGSVSNVILVHRNQIYIPPLAAAQLEGITLRTMAELLEEEGYKIHYEQIDRSMVYCCDELMMVGTAVQISFVASVDGRRIGPIEDVMAGKDPKPGPVCCRLRELYAEILAGKHPKSKQWLVDFSI